MRSSGCPEVRIMGRSGQRSFTSHDRSTRVHGAGKPDVREDHGDLSPADQHDRKRSFRAFTLNGVDLFVLEERRREAAEFSVVLDDQYGPIFLLRLPHGPVPFGALVVDRHSIGA